MNESVQRLVLKYLEATFIIAAEGSTPNLDMKVSPEFTRPSLSRRSMYCRDFDLCLSVRPSRCRNSGGERTGGVREKY